jgi:hypothetical protein
MVCHKWCTRFDNCKPWNNDHIIYPLHKTQCCPYFPFRNYKLTGRQWKPILLGEMPIPVPNQNLAASPLQLFTYVITGELTQCCSINRLCGFVTLPEEFSTLTTVNRLNSTSKVCRIFQKKETNNLKSTNNPEKGLLFKKEILHVSASRHHYGPYILYERQLPTLKQVKLQINFQLTK